MVQMNTSESAPVLGDESVKCGCKDHLGSVLLDSVFNMDVDSLYECLIEDTAFNKRINDARKITDIQAGEWEDLVENDKTIKMRKLEYNVGLNGTLGAKSCKTNEQTKILIRELGRLTVIESETISTGVPYSDTFLVRTRLCMTRQSSNSARFVAHVAIVFVTKPMAFIKKIIEKSCMGTISGYFTQLEQFLKEEATRKQTEAITNGHEISTVSRVENRPATPTKFNSSSKRSKQVDGLPVKAPKNSISSDSSSSSLNNHPDDSSDQASELLVDNKGPRLRKTKYNQNHEALLTGPNVASPSVQNTSECCHQVETNGVQTSIQSNKKEIRVLVKQDENPSNQLFFIGYEMTSSLFLNLFFIIMVVLVVFNLVLYLKLREIENLAQYIKRNKLHNSFPNV